MLDRWRRRRRGRTLAELLARDAARLGIERPALELGPFDSGWPFGPVTPKSARPCCAAQRDAHGRFPIGYCGPDCQGRAERAARAKAASS